jgi:hypothetical protein
MANVQSIAVSGAGALAFAAGTSYELRTPVAIGGRSVFRRLFGLRVNAGGVADGIRFAPTSASFALTFSPLDGKVRGSGSTQPQAFVETKGSQALAVTLPVPMQITRINFSISSGTVELYRMDGDVLAKEFTKDPSDAGLIPGDFTDRRFGLKLKSGSSYQNITAASLVDVHAKGFPTSARIGIAPIPATGQPLAPNFFFVIPGEVGRPNGPAGSANIGNQLAVALQQHFDAIEPPYTQAVDLLLVAESDAPCKLQASTFAIPYGMLRTSFRAVLLRAADITAPVALATRLREASTPLTAYLRSKLSTYTRSALARASDRDLPAPVLAHMLRELNTALQAEAFYTAARFAGITLKPETLTLATSGVTGVARTRVNRTLLEEAFPREIAAIAAASGDEKEVLSADGAHASLNVKVDVPRPIAIRAAALRLEGDLRSDAPGGAAPAGNGSPTAPSWDAPIPDHAGFMVDATHSVATSFTPSSALEASGVALALSAASATVELTAELRADQDGTPAGSVIASALATVAQLDQPAWTLFAFATPVIVPAAACWIVLRATHGAALWLAADATGIVRIGDPATKAWTERGAFTDRAPLHQLWTKTTASTATTSNGSSPDVAERLRIAIGTALLTPAAGNGSKTRMIDIKAALQAFLASVPPGGQLVSTPIRVSALGKGSVTIYPPEIEYDVL